MCDKIFDLTPITTSNLFTLAQILVVGIGFYLSYRSLQATRDSVALATKNAMAQLVNQMIVQGRELQYKTMEIEDRSPPADEITKKEDQLDGMIIGYYSSCFELRSILQLPQNIADLLDVELSYIMRQPAMQTKWAAVKNFYSAKFQAHVESLKEK